MDRRNRGSIRSVGVIWLKAGTWNFNDPQLPPSTFRLATKPLSAAKTEKQKQSLLLDFGRETFGFVKLHGLSGKGAVNIYYGECLGSQPDLSAGKILPGRQTNFTRLTERPLQPLYTCFVFVTSTGCKVFRKDCIPSEI